MSKEKSKKKIFRKKKTKRTLFHKIVNFFIGLVGLFLFLLIIFFGFSQTKTFREFLRKQITNQVAESLNANIHIERIDGSILSSVILHNTILYSEGDTLIDAKEITIKTSPAHLLLKKILVREISLKNALVNMKENDKGEWNFASILREPDTVKTDTMTNNENKEIFPFVIQINNLVFHNVNFVRQTYKNLNSKKFYNNLNFDDLRFSNIFLDAKVYANLSSSVLRLYLNNFSVSPNFNSFNLKELSCIVELTKEYARVSNLTLKSDSSLIELDARIDSLNLLGNVELKDFKEYPIQIQAQAKPFNFDDLSTFIDATNILKGKANFDINAKGYFGNLDVSKFDVDYLNTHLALKGNVKNLHIPEKLFFDVKLTNSTLIESDITKLLPEIAIPFYDSLVFRDIDINFKGEPLRFHTTLNSNVGKGNIHLNTFMDLTKRNTEYDIKFNTKDLNLSPIIGTKTKLNSTGTIKGKGFDPNTMLTNLNIFANSSSFDQVNIDSLSLNGSADSKIIRLKLSSIINDANTSVLGVLDLTDSKEPLYDLTGRIDGLNLEKFTNQPSDSSNLNFTFSAKGKNLELDDLVGNYNIKLEPSFLRGIELDESKIDLALNKKGDERKINLISEFVDFNIDGKFSLQKAIDILTYESIIITDNISKKIDELNPIDSKIKIKHINNSAIPEIVKEPLAFNFYFKFKDFDLIALFLQNERLDISGSGSGNVKNDSAHFAISTDINIDNLLNKRKDNILYLSNINTNLNFSRDNRIISYNKIFGTITLEGEKIYSGVEIKDIVADFIFNKNKLFFNASLDVGNDLTTEMEGNINTIGETQEIIFDNILVDYKNIEWETDKPNKILFTDAGIKLDNFALTNANTKLSIDGNINNDDTHNLVIEINDFPGKIISKYFLDKNQQPINADINFNITSSGLLNSPEIISNLYIDNLAYDGIKFGDLASSFSYLNNNGTIDVIFTEKKHKHTNTLFTMKGNLPININYLDSTRFISDTKEISLSLKANNFNIATFANLLPYIKNQHGKILAEIDITGKLNDLHSNGFIKLKDGRFTYRDNNLDYSIGIKSTIKNQKAVIDSLVLSNYSGSKYKGTMTGNGFIELKKLPFSKIDVTINGDLALLGKKSKTRKASIYGDLFIKTDNNWKFIYENGRFNFDGNVLVENANLIYASQEQTKGENSQIIYKYVKDTTNVNKNEQMFRDILSLFKKKNNNFQEKSNFDFKTNIIIKNIVSFDFLMFPELNQKLHIETTGELEFQSINNEFKTQGTLQLLEGSRLEFFKTFDAKGNIRFESDVTNPHLDIVATYIGEIENFEGTNKTEDVAVKLRMDSPLSELGKNLANDKENLLVYVGRTQIENDIPDPRYDAANALTFILLGQLSLNLTEEQKSTLSSWTENTAYSLLGSQLTSYLNSVFGGIINNIRVQRNTIENSYKFLFSGKYNNIRYSFGGNTKYFQAEKADIKVEYLFNPNFLIRIQQKDPIVPTNDERKIQELGLKLKLAF
jgi:hypothetical protein